MNLSVHQKSPKPLSLESWNSHIVQVLPRQRTNAFQNQFYCPFYQFYWKEFRKEFSESATSRPYPEHRPDKHVRKGQGAAFWQIDLYYIIRIVQWGAVGQRLERATKLRARDWQSSAHGFESRWGRSETFAVSFTPLCQCFSEETLKAVGPILHAIALK